jgi:hypothetical protein
MAIVVLAAAILLVPLVASIVSPAQAPHLNAVSDQALAQSGIVLDAPPPRILGCDGLTAAALQVGRDREEVGRLCPVIYDGASAEALVGRLGSGSPVITEAVHADCSITPARLSHRDCWVVVARVPFVPCPHCEGARPISGHISSGTRWQGKLDGPGTYLVFVDARTNRPLAAIQVAGGPANPQSLTGG